MEYDLPDFAFDESQKNRLDMYLKLLQKWQKSINLVSASTLDQVFDRHIMDSVQIAQIVSRETEVLDLGSGAGFPGMILAICRPDLSVTLLDSDQRKCEFLKVVSRETKTNVAIINDRLEISNLTKPHFITARGFKSIRQILLWLHQKWDSLANIQLILHKGKDFLIEINEAKKDFYFDVVIYQSKTSEDGRILRLTNVMKIQ